MKMKFNNQPQITNHQPPTTNHKSIVIGIDGNEANIENRVGVNQYASELLIHLEKLKESHDHKFVIYLRNKPLPHLPKPRDGWEYKILEGGGMWILKVLMPHLWMTKNRPDIFFTPSHYLPPFLPMPGVISIMDLGYLNSREQFRKYDYFQLKYWGSYSMRIARKIIAISESTKKEIINHYSWAKNKIEVIHLAYDKSQFNSGIKKSDVARVCSKYKINGKYILFLGTLKPSKNIEGLIEGFSLLKNKDLKLVVAGKKGWHFDSIFNKVSELKLNSRVIFTDFIKEEEKAPLIKGASVFVLPSYWEGFGIPVLEAMACGVPVVVSKIASLPEITDTAGVYIDPENSESIAKGIENAMLNKKELIKKGLMQANKFSWEKMASDTLKLLLESRS